MSLAALPLTTLRKQLVPTDAAAATLVAKALIGNNNKLGNSSSDIVAELGQSEAMLSTAFFSRFAGRDIETQMFALVNVLVDVLRIHDNRDSLSELGEEQQLRLQMMMDRLSKSQSMLSNLLKKAADSSNATIGNMK